MKITEHLKWTEEERIDIVLNISINNEKLIRNDMLKNKRDIFLNTVCIQYVLIWQADFLNQNLTEINNALGVK